MTCGNNIFQWVMINQAQYPHIQNLVEQLAGRTGDALLLTGNPCPAAMGSRLAIRQGPIYEAGSKTQRALSWLRFLIWSAAQILLLGGRPLVFAVTQPPMLPNLVWLLCRLRGLPYGVLVWDIFPDSLVHLGMARSGGMVPAVWQKLNRRMLNDACFVITLSAGMAEVLKKQAGNPSLPVSIIPNWADTEALRPVIKAANPFARSYNQIDRLTVFYSGNMGLSHGLADIAEVVRALQDRPDIHFIFIGDGTARPELERRITSCGLENALFLPYQSRDMLNYWLPAADLGLIMQAEGMENLCFPSKLYFMMAAGAAILAISKKGSDLDLLIRRLDCGVSFSADQPQEIASEIRSLAGNRHRLEHYRRNSRAAAEKYFNKDIALESFAGVLRAAL